MYVSSNWFQTGAWQIIKWQCLIKFFNEDDLINAIGWFSLTSCKLYGTYENCHKGGWLTRFFLSILMIYYDGDIENRAY